MLIIRFKINLFKRSFKNVYKKCLTSSLFLCGFPIADGAQEGA